jgi:hypothetical protein
MQIDTTDTGPTVAATEFAFYDSSNIQATATFLGYLITDTIRNATGSIDSIHSKFLVMENTVDTSNNFDYMRQLYPPITDPNDGRGIIVQILTVVYKTTPVADSVVVTSPNGGESWDAGTQKAITWKTFGDIDSVIIEYSTGNGWMEIDSSYPNIGTYTWSVPDDESNAAKVRISSSSSVAFDESDAVFSILPLPSNDADLINLVVWTGELYPVFSPSVTSYVDTVDNSTTAILITPFASDPGASITVNGSPVNSGSVSQPIALVDGSNMVNVVVTAQDGITTKTYSIDVYRIPNTLTLISPNGGETWYVGSIKTITWVSTGDISEVKLDYSADGDSWHTIINPTENDSTHDWTIPNDTSTQVMVRIRTLDNSIADTCNAVFEITIEPVINVLLPAGGEVWGVGTVQELTWNSVGDITDVKIEYKSADTTWIEITSETSNDGSFNWTVPNYVSTDVTVRISSLDGSIIGESYAFEIEPATALSWKPNGFTFSIAGLGTIYSSNEVEIHTVRIIDLQGELVREIPVSAHHVIWDGKNRYGKDKTAGLYLIQFISDIKTETLKAVLAY